MVTSRIWFTAAQKAELWERWKNGQSAAAISRALERKNKTGVERIVVLHGGIVPEILDITYNDFKAQSPQNLEPSLQGAQNILKQFPDVNQNVGAYLDTSLLGALKNEGFFTAMEQRYRS